MNEYDRIEDIEASLREIVAVKRDLSCSADPRVLKKLDELSELEMDLKVELDDLETEIINRCSEIGAK